MAENAAETKRVLVVSRDMSLLRPLWAIGESNSWQLETATSGWEGMERVQSDVAPHLLLLDLPHGDSDSLHILRWLRRLRPDLPVIVICHSEDARKQNEATRLGAEEVLVRPFKEDQLEGVIRMHLDSANENVEAQIASDDIESVGEDEFFLSASPVMQKLRAQAELLAQVDVPVLILGEPGSGKGTVARLIHKLSVYSGFKFQRVNCAEMPADLLESELFGRKNGHWNGNSNGAGRPNPGKLEAGEKGTLLLDEITQMPLELQSRVLQVLQNTRSVRSGDDGPLAGDVRVLAASSDKLDRALTEKRLREDLYRSLSSFTIHVPPLRHRKEEIKVLLRYSMHKLARYYGLTPREFSASALRACLDYSWPGNLEELQTFVKRYLVAGEKELPTNALEANPGSNGLGSGGRVFGLAAIPNEAVAYGASPSVPKSLKSLIHSVKCEAEKGAIAAALEKTGWNRKAAARQLGVSYRTILYKIDQYHMSASEPFLSPFPEVGLAGSDQAKGNGKAS